MHAIDFKPSAEQLLRRAVWATRVTELDRKEIKELVTPA